MCAFRLGLVGHCSVVAVAAAGLVVCGTFRGVSVADTSALVIYQEVCKFLFGQNNEETFPVRS
jgi:hypothetical protein